MQITLKQLAKPLVGEADERVWVLLQNDYRAEFVGNRVQFHELPLVFFLVYRRPGLWVFAEESTGRSVANGTNKPDALKQGTQRLNNIRLRGDDTLLELVNRWPEVKTYPDSAPCTKLGKDDEPEDKPIPRIKFSAVK